MKFEAINKKFNELVAGYMANGYYFNAGTMGGSQGEIAHVDLTNGKEIIRVVMDYFSDEINGYMVDGIELIVGRSTDKALPNRNRSYDTIWNNRLEVLHTERYYEIGRRANEEDWYGTKEECVAKWEKAAERWRACRVETEKKFPEEAKKAALSFVKKQPKCKGTKLDDITSVVKRCEQSRFNGEWIIQYKVTAKGRTYIMK